METVKKYNLLKAKAVKEVKILKDYWQSNVPPIIADIGGNVGYYTEAFLEVFTRSMIHSYEIHPANLKHLYKITSDRASIHPYGLFNESKQVSVGLPSDRLEGNGCYSIYRSAKSTFVEVRNANDELIRPEIVKLDVEGSEPQILECRDFFSNTVLILVEILAKDDLEMNSLIIDRLQELKFEYVKNTSKNNQLWKKV